jgi:predicted ATPase
MTNREKPIVSAVALSAPRYGGLAMTFLCHCEEPKATKQSLPIKLIASDYVEEGIAQIRQGLATLRAAGDALQRPGRLVLLAQAYAKAGQVEAGLSTLAEAIAALHQKGQQPGPELYRLKGELMLKSKIQGLKSKVEKEAEECFCKAIEIARKQQAKSWELRATMSLSRLWQSQGKEDEARQTLAEIYGWFTEGFETKDLQEAKALLEELS